MFNIDQEAPAETAAVQQLTALISLVTNPAAAQKEIDRLIAAAARAREETTAANNAKAAAKHEVEVAIKAKAALVDKEVEIDRQRNDLINREEIIKKKMDDLVVREDQLRHRLLKYAGRELHPLQNLPSTESLEAELAGRRSDAHFDDQVPEGEFRTGPAPDRVAGATISRTVRGRPPRPVLRADQ